MSSPIIPLSGVVRPGGIVRLEDVLQQVAEHKGCGTSSEGGKASCGSSAGPADMSPEIWEKVKNHPCYSEEAHHHYARMHVNTIAPMKAVPAWSAKN